MCPQNEENRKPIIYWVYWIEFEDKLFMKIVPTHKDNADYSLI